ncbi:actin family [Blakeslea trispora]|nr:actin family [Blakeslea trispora]
MAPINTLILDNGAYTIKAGLAQENASVKLIPNAIVKSKGEKRQYIGDQLDNCTDFSSLYYRLPFERGLLTNWNTERTIWDRLFQHAIPIDPKETRLLLSEPCFNLPALQDTYDQIVFEEYEFNACYRTLGPQFCLWNDLSVLFGDVPDCVLVIDSGYSFTHIVPFFQQMPLAKGIRRLNVGGKLLTNHLKEVVSFRAYDMMEETFIMNDVKEKCCFVSQHVLDDLKGCKQKRNQMVQEYVLPDFIQHTTGHIRTKDSPVHEQQQILTMNNERFMIPEILMHPSDIGLDQAGIPEAIVQSVSACDEAMQGLLYANIVLVGGNAHLPGFQERIQHELRPFVPDAYEIRIRTPKDPITFSWEGGNQYILQSSKSQLQKTFVNRKEYMEYGSSICRRKFNSSYSHSGFE